MITERELRRVACRSGLGVGQAEHKYVILCLLNALSQTSLLSETLCLKGGTALRQLYFPDWRHSVDLDFSVLPAFPAEQLKACLSVFCTGGGAARDPGDARGLSQAERSGEAAGAFRGTAALSWPPAPRCDPR
jgi:hypothetical protein